jgi:ligand-binding SRPBCC domain-containing protein
MAVTFEYRSVVAAPPDHVWRRITSPEGINDELMPFMRMTVPRTMKGKSFDEAATSGKVGRSWFLALGFLPIDFDDITIAEYDRGRRFLERSTMLSMSSWEHERIVTGRDEGTEVRDRVTFQERRPIAWIPGAHFALEAFLRRLFEHRHRRLRRWFSPLTR